MAEAMQTHLSAGGASCQICFEPFGQLEDLSAPFIVACGHVFCVGCLHDAGPGCPICGMAYDRASYVRLLGLRTSAPRRQRRIHDVEAMGAKLRQGFARVSDLTTVGQLRSLHSEARYFLDSQPRNRFKDLETNIRLLQCLLETKETLQVQGALMDTFVEQIHHLSAEKIDLSLQLVDIEQQHASERAYIRDHVSEFLRQDPDFELLSDEVLQFQSDMNDLRESVHTLQVRNDAAQRASSSPAPVPPIPVPYQQLDTAEWAPRIRVYPASRSPSPVPSALESAYESLSPLSMSAIGDDFGSANAEHPSESPPPFSFSEGGENLDIPVRARPLASGGGGDVVSEREVGGAQIRGRSRLAYASAPDLRALSEAEVGVVGGEGDGVGTGVGVGVAAGVETREQDVESSSLDSPEMLHDGGEETPYYSPLAGSDGSLVSSSSQPQSASPSRDELDPPADILVVSISGETEEAVGRDPPPEPLASPNSDSELRARGQTGTSEATASVPLSSLSTPSLPLLRTPPDLRFLPDLDARLNQLLLTNHRPSAPRRIRFSEPPVTGVDAGVGVGISQAQVQAQVQVQALPRPGPGPGRLPLPRRQGTLNVRALNELLHDLVGLGSRSAEHLPEMGGLHSIGNGAQFGGGGGGSGSGSGSLLGDVRTGLVVLARVLVHLAAANTTGAASIHAPIVQVPALLGGGPQGHVGDGAGAGIGTDTSGGTLASLDASVESSVPPEEGRLSPPRVTSGLLLASELDVDRGNGNGNGESLMTYECRDSEDGIPANLFEGSRKPSEV